MRKNNNEPSHRGRRNTNLTTREQIVLSFYLDGYRSIDIAKKLFRSAKTIDTHRANIWKKLDIADHRAWFFYVHANYKGGV